MAFVGPLTDVDVPGAESKRLLDRLLLSLEVARQIEVHVVLRRFTCPGRKKAETEAGVITWQERDGGSWFVGNVPAQETSPELRNS